MIYQRIPFCAIIVFIIKLSSILSDHMECSFSALSRLLDTNFLPLFSFSSFSILYNELLKILVKARSIDSVSGNILCKSCSNENKCIARVEATKPARYRLRLWDVERESTSTPPRIDRTVDASSFWRNTCWADSPPRPSLDGHLVNDRGMCDGISVISGWTWSRARQVHHERFSSSRL